MDFLFLDPTTRRPAPGCRGTDRSPGEALTAVADVLQATGVGSRRVGVKERTAITVIGQRGLARAPRPPASSSSLHSPKSSQALATPLPSSPFG